jgi:hypothetical protein
MNFSSWDWICAELVKTWSRQRKAKAAGLGKTRKMMLKEYEEEDQR